MTTVTGSVNPQLLQEAAVGNAVMQQMTTAQNFSRVQGRDGQPISGFPAQISTADPQDSLMALKAGLVGPGGVVENVGVAVTTDQDFAYFERKQDAQREAAFKAWVMENADLTTPASTAWWYSKVPWLRTSREAYIDYVARLQLQDAKITLNGPQTEEDMRFIFMKQNKMINIPGVALQNLATAAETQENLMAKDYKEGFFSPWSLKLYDKAQPVGYSYPTVGKFTWGNSTGPRESGQRTEYRAAPGLVGDKIGFPVTKP